MRNGFTALSLSTALHNAAQISYFPEPSSPLKSSDWRNVQNALNILTQNDFESLADTDAPSSFFGLTKREVKISYDLHEAHARQADRLKDIREGLEKASNLELGAMMQRIAADGMNYSAAHIIADRNRQNESYGSEIFDREARRKIYARNVKLEKALGGTIDEARSFYNNFKFFPTITAHPTKDKNDLGEQLYREKSRLADTLSGTELQEALIENDTQILRHRVTPEQKDDLAKETDDALMAQRIIQRGNLNWLLDKQEALDEVYGLGVIDFMADDMNIDIAARRWQGGDADGKPIPAPVLFTLRVKGAHEALKDYLELFGDHEELKEERAVFEQFARMLEPIYKSLPHLEKQPSNSPDFLAAKSAFTDIFTSTHYKGSAFQRGPELTHAVNMALKEKAAHLLANAKTREAGRAARSVVLMHQQVGIALGKQEIRHNGEDYKKIFDNFFEYIRENDLAPLPDNIKKFSDMTAKNQAVFLKRFCASHEDKIKDWLVAANKKDEWPNEILERFEVIRSCYNHNRMGFAIIAEADASSAVLQQVLADSFGIKNMVHCPLNESEQTIEKAAEALHLYREVFGARNLISKIKNTPQDQKTPPLFFSVMDPQSDSQKSYGFSIKFLQRCTDQELIETAIRPVLDTMKPEIVNGSRDKLEGVFAGVLRKIGTGASYARGGFSPKAVPRMFISALSEMDGIDIRNIPDDIKPVLKQMVSFVSTTIQGRDIGMRMGTAEEVQDLVEDVERECRMACMAIDGHIDPALIVDLAPDYSLQMRSAIQKNAKAARNEFYEMRTRSSLSQETEHFNRRLMDVYMQRVSALKVAEFTNVGARKDARDDLKGKKKKPGVSKKDVSSLRAIGSNGANVNAENLFDGSYTLGLMLAGLHEDYKAGHINQRDLHLFKDDAFFMQQMLPNVISALAAADYEHGFDALNGDGPTWTVGRLIELKQNKWSEKGKTLDELTKFHAVLAYDALLATSMTEALLETPRPWMGGKLGTMFGSAAKGLLSPKGFDKSEADIILSVYNTDDRLNTLKFGDKTHARFPHISTTEAMAQEKRLARAIVHETERRIDLSASDPENPSAIHPDTAEGKDLLFHIACARRMLGPINMENNLGTIGLGARKEPLMETILRSIPVLHRPHIALNDNKQEKSYGPYEYDPIIAPPIHG